MKVLIFTELLQGTGMGHFARCSALCDAIKKHALSVEIILDYDEEIYRKHSDLEVTWCHWTQGSQLLGLLSSQKKFIAVVDSYRAEIDLYRLIGTQASQSIAIDDDQRLQYPLQWNVLNTCVHGKKYNYSQNNSYTGAEYALLREAFIGKQTKHLAGGPIRDILISVGVNPAHSVIETIVDQVSRTFPDVKMHIIGQESKKIKNSQYGKQAAYYQNLSATQICELMRLVDLAVSAGGQTTYELASQGVPMVVFCVAENQVDSLDYFVSFGAAISAGDARSSQFPVTMHEALKQVSNKSCRASLAKKAHLLVDGQGARRVAGLIHSMTK